MIVSGWEEKCPYRGIFISQREMIYAYQGIIISWQEEKCLDHGMIISWKEMSDTCQRIFISHQGKKSRKKSARRKASINLNFLALVVAPLAEKQFMHLYPQFTRIGGLRVHF